MIFTVANGMIACRAGRGADSMSGGDGRDLFVISRGRDLIRDFSTIQGDVIQINRAIFGSVEFVATPDCTGTVISHAFGSAAILGVTPEALQNSVNINYIP
jgi:Ca2+-binding RTX toxin-like protein